MVMKCTENNKWSRNKNKDACRGCRQWVKGCKEWKTMGIGPWNWIQAGSGGGAGSGAGTGSILVTRPVGPHIKGWMTLFPFIFCLRFSLFPFLTLSALSSILFIISGFTHEDSSESWSSPARKGGFRRRHRAGTLILFFVFFCLVFFSYTFLRVPVPEIENTKQTNNQA